MKLKLVPDKIKFAVEKRIHSLAPKGEWALFCQFEDYDRWVVWVWKKEPNEEEVKQVKTMILRGMEIYHRHMTLPPFYVKEVE